MKQVVLIIFILFATAQAWAQHEAKGYVFEDKNANGRKEHGEKGITGVAVSNGREVVLTGKKGRYELPVGKDNPVFVIKPTGYALETDANNLPQFYYLYKPEGSPQLNYPGVPPSGNLPSSIDFALTPAREDDSFTALIFGDPQVRDKKEVGYLRRGVVAEVEGINNVAFGLSLGDLAFNDLDMLPLYVETMQHVGIPWFNVMGNHDMNYDVTADSLADETFESHFGPTNYSYNYGKVHFILLDDILYPDPKGSTKYRGGFREDQLEFIENDLHFVPKDRLIVLAYHIPLADIRDVDRQRIFDLLEAYPHTLSLSAHTHRQRQDFFTGSDGWDRETPHHEYNVGTSCGSWYSGEPDENGIPYSTMKDGTPKGYAFIRFDSNQYVIDYKVYDKPKDYQIGISAPKVVAHNMSTAAAIYANYYMGSSRDTLSYRVDDGKWEAMTYTPGYDPAYLDIIHKWDYSNTLLQGRRPGNAMECTHLWKAKIPVDLEPGEHTIEIKVVDMYGRTITQQGTYRIEEPASNP